MDRLSDVGNAHRLIERHGQDIRWCPQYGWLVWDGVRWKPDQLNRVQELAKESVITLLLEAVAMTDDGGRQALIGWAKRSHGKPRIKNLIELAYSDERVAATIEVFDRQARLLNVLNGTLDVETLELQQHRREDLITRLCPAEWDPDARGPEFERFLERILPDVEVRGYVQRLLGSALEGQQVEHVLPFLVGGGGNGKSTLTRVVQEVLGPDYSISANTSLIMATRNGPHTESKVSLRGKVLVFARELEEGGVLSEASVKDLTGDDIIRARSLYKPEFDIIPTWRLVCVTNHRPIIRGTDDAIWRRVTLVPFDVQIPEEEQDGKLKEKLRREGSAVLRWLVDGYTEWRSRGLDAPESVRVATAGYRTEMDDVGRFVKDNCDVAEGLWSAIGALGIRYTEWRRDGNPGRQLDNRKLADELVRLGFTRRKGTGNVAGIDGLGLRPGNSYGAPPANF